MIQVVCNCWVCQGKLCDVPASAVKVAIHCPMDRDSYYRTVKLLLLAGF